MTTTRGNCFTAIHAVVRRIPRGAVATYGQVAWLAGVPGSARVVGYALRVGPRELPWHRVVAAGGRIALPADSTAALTQRRRLQAEGVVFTGPRVDMARCAWVEDQP